MQELNYGIGKLVKFTAALEDSAKKFPELRRELHEEFAREMDRVVSGKIRSSLTGSSGNARGKHGGAAKIVGWQGEHVGSGGGYAAYRPDKGDGQITKNETYTIGRITNAIESGHITAVGERPGRSGKYDYRDRSKQGYVQGKFFYKDAHDHMEQVAEERVAQFVEELKRRLEV